jgi:hypothetical protein
MWDIHTMEYYWVMKQDEILSLATTELKVIISEISHAQKDKYHVMSLICRILKC